MQIFVKEQGHLAVLNKDGEFKCPHEDVSIEKPCCNGNNCDCGGSYSVYCNDCGNEDITEEQIEEFLADYFDGYEEAQVARAEAYIDR